MINDADIQEIISLFIEVGNKDGELSRIVEHYKGSRSLALTISDSKVQTGFLMRDGRLQALAGVKGATITVSMPKLMFFDIVNSPNAATARAKIYTAVFTTEKIRMDPPPGMEAGMLHFQNVVKVFSFIAEKVL